MKMISLLLFHLAVSAFGQEELVALNPVLKDHSISYTDPISVRSKYESVATFDPWECTMFTLLRIPFLISFNETESYRTVSMHP